MQPTEKLSNIASRIGRRETFQQRGHDLFHRPAVTELNDCCTGLVEDQQPFGKHELVLLADSIPAIARVANQYGTKG